MSTVVNEKTQEGEDDGDKPQKKCECNGHSETCSKLGKCLVREKDKEEYVKELRIVETIQRGINVRCVSLDTMEILVKEQPLIALLVLVRKLITQGIQ